MTTHTVKNNPMPFDQVQCTHLFFIEFQPPGFDLFLVLHVEWWFGCRVGHAYVFIGCQSATNVSHLVRMKKCRIQSRRLHHIGAKDAFDLVLNAHSGAPLIFMRNTEDLSVTILGNLICPVTLALAYDQKERPCSHSWYTYQWLISPVGATMRVGAC